MLCFSLVYFEYVSVLGRQHLLIQCLQCILDHFLLLRVEEHSRIYTGDLVILGVGTSQSGNWFVTVSCSACWVQEPEDMLVWVIS